jgi:hypothetical protein
MRECCKNSYPLVEADLCAKCSACCSYGHVPDVNCRGELDTWADDSLHKEVHPAAVPLWARGGETPGRKWGGMGSNQFSGGYSENQPSPKIICRAHGQCKVGLWAQGIEILKQADLESFPKSKGSAVVGREVQQKVVRSHLEPAKAVCTSRPYELLV